MCHDSSHPPCHTHWFHHHSAWITRIHQRFLKFIHLIPLPQLQPSKLQRCSLNRCFVTSGFLKLLLVTVSPNSCQEYEACGCAYVHTVQTTGPITQNSSHVLSTSKTPCGTLWLSLTHSSVCWVIRGLSTPGIRLEAAMQGTKEFADHRSGDTLGYNVGDRVWLATQDLQNISSTPNT